MLQGLWVGPMGILEDYQHRLLACQSRNLCCQGLPAFFACAAAGPDRARDSVHRLGATASRQKARRPALRSRSAPAPCRACRASLAGCRSDCALYLADDRIKCTVGVLRRAEVAKPVYGPAASRSSSSAVSRDLPIPASPDRSTSVRSPTHSQTGTVANPNQSISYRPCRPPSEPSPRVTRNAAWRT
jgi:hypothetical protein